MPMLFYVAAITGLRPTSEVFGPYIQKKDKISFNSKRSSFTNFIVDQFDEATKEVFDKEHIAFLSLWLYHFVFCSDSL